MKASRFDDPVTMPPVDQTPRCEQCGGLTVPVSVTPDDVPDDLLLSNAGFCPSCSTLIVEGTGTIIHVLVQMTEHAQ